MEGVPALPAPTALLMVAFEGVWVLGSCGLCGTNYLKSGTAAFIQIIKKMGPRICSLGHSFLQAGPSWVVSAFSISPQVVSMLVSWLVRLQVLQLNW